MHFKPNKTSRCKCSLVTSVCTMSLPDMCTSLQQVWAHCLKQNPTTCNREITGDACTHAGSSLNLGSEGIRVALQDGFHSRLPGALVLHVVTAVDAVTAIAVTPRCKALTVPVGIHICILLSCAVLCCALQGVDYAESINMSSCQAVRLRHEKQHK